MTYGLRDTDSELTLNEGEWEHDKRSAKFAKMLFSDGTMYKGQFIDDRADG